MKKHFNKSTLVKTVNLVNPMNGDTWCCTDYDNTKIIDGVDYITVFKPENEKRTFLMRKDALKLSKGLIDGKLF
jgi:hypothetical protein